MRPSTPVPSAATHRHHPDATHLVLSSDRRRPLGVAAQVLATVRSAGVKAHFLDFTPYLNGTFGVACCGHPGSEVDAAMANKAAATIAAALGW